MGRGYPLYSIPRNVNDWYNADAIVVFIMNFPLLDKNSVFDPFCPLTEIKFWKENLGLISTVKNKNIQYLVFEQLNPCTGEDISHANNNRNWLESNLELEFENSIALSHEVLNVLVVLQANKTKNSNGRKPFILFTNAAKRNFSEEIQILIDNEDVCHVKAKLYGGNLTIINKIKDCL